MQGRIQLYEELFAGISVADMTHLPEISRYNRNFYTKNGRLLFGKSDDENFTQWYWVQGDKVVSIGGSYDYDGDIIIVGPAYT